MGAFFGLLILAVFVGEGLDRIAKAIRSLSNR